MSVSRLFDCSPDRPILSFIEGFFAHEGLDEITIRLKEILMSALMDSEDYSISCLNGNIPVLTCKRGSTTIEIREIYESSNEISFHFQVDKEYYILILDAFYGMKNCDNLDFKFAERDAIYSRAILNDKSFAGKFETFVTGSDKSIYDGQNGYLRFSRAKDNNNNNLKQIEFLITDFLDVLEHGIEYGDWKQFIEFCNTGTKDKTRML